MIDFCIITNQLILTNMKHFKCQDCDKTFKYLSLYQRHKPIHTHQKDFKCDFCDKAFNRPDTLKTHLNIHQGTGFPCCGRFFHSKAALRYHQRATHKVKVSNCKQYGGSFQNQKDLQNAVCNDIITEFPMLLDCIATEDSSSGSSAQKCDQPILVIDEGVKKHSIWSQGDMLLSYIRM